MANDPVSTRTPSFYRSSAPPNARLSEPALAPVASGIVIMFSSLGALGRGLVGDGFIAFCPVMVALIDARSRSANPMYNGKREGEFPPRGKSSPAIRERDQPGNQSHFEENPEWSLSERHSSGHYRAVAARARRLQTEVTTPRLKQYLADTIARSEQLAGEVDDIQKPNPLVIGLGNARMRPSRR